MCGQFGSPRSPSPDFKQQEGPAPIEKDAGNLATQAEHVPGGGTVLPFGKQPGELAGYSTLPDPQVACVRVILQPED